MDAFEKLKEICEGATPGIWHVHKTPGDGLAPGFGPKNNPIGECWHVKDAAAIVVVHNALPDLIELVEAQGDMLVCLTSGTEGKTIEEYADKMVNATFKALSARAKLEESIR